MDKQNDMKGVIKVLPMTTEGIYDRIANANPRKISNVVMTCLNALQNAPPADQIAAIAILMRAFCIKYNQRPAAIMELVSNMVREARRYDKATFEAVGMYFDEEIN